MAYIMYGIGEVLPLEVGNRHDPYAVTVKKDELVVGHLPRKISCICSIFIRRGEQEAVELSAYEMYYR